MGQIRGVQNERQKRVPQLQTTIAEPLRAGPTLRPLTPYDRSSQTTPYDRSSQTTPYDRSTQTTPYDRSSLMTPYDRTSQMIPFDRSSQTTPSNQSSQIPENWPARSEGDPSTGYEMKFGGRHLSMSSKNWDRHQEPQDLCFTRHDDSMYSLQGQGPWQHSGFQEAKSTEFRSFSAPIVPARYSVAERVKTPWTPTSGTSRSFSNKRPRTSQSWYHHEEDRGRRSRNPGDPAVFTMLDCLMETPPTTSPESDHPRWQQPDSPYFDLPTATSDGHCDEPPSPDFSPADTAKNFPRHAEDQGDLSAFKFPTSGLGNGQGGLKPPIYTGEPDSYDPGLQNHLAKTTYTIDGQREGDEFSIAPEFDENQNPWPAPALGDLDFRPEEVSFVVRARAW